MAQAERAVSVAERAAIAAACPHTDCAHENTYTCSGWANAVDALGGVPDGWAKLEDQWVKLALFDVVADDGETLTCWARAPIPERDDG